MLTNIFIVLYFLYFWYSRILFSPNVRWYADPLGPGPMMRSNRLSQKSRVFDASMTCFIYRHMFWDVTIPRTRACVTFVCHIFIPHPPSNVTRLIWCHIIQTAHFFHDSFRGEKHKCDAGLTPEILFFSNKKHSEKIFGTLFLILKRTYTVVPE